MLFGLEGETRATIDETVEQMARLMAEGLLTVSSPNILTYHPGTPITRAHGREEGLDYHSLGGVPRPPYVYFEEAFPEVVTSVLSEDDVRYIRTRTLARWTQKLQPRILPITGLLPAGRGARLDTGVLFPVKKPARDAR